MLGLSIGSTSRAQLAPLYHLPLSTSLIKYIKQEVHCGDGRVHKYSNAGY